MHATAAQFGALLRMVQPPATPAPAPASSPAPETEQEFVSRCFERRAAPPFDARTVMTALAEEAAAKSAAKRAAADAAARSRTQG